MDKAIDRLLEKYQLAGCKTVSSPALCGVDFVDSPKNDSFPLRSLIGALLYIQVCARPDIAFAVQRVACHVASPTDAAVNAAKRICRYLAGSRNRGVEYSPEKENSFRKTYTKIAESGGKQLGDAVAFTDADYAGCCHTLKSTSGSIIYFKGCPVAWQSKKQACRATSTCESEYYACFDCIKLSKSQGFLDFVLEEDQVIPLTLCDNQSAIALAHSSMVTKKSKHIMMRYHEVKDHFESLCFVPTDVNMADPLTKPLPSDKYVKMFFVNSFEKDQFFVNCEIQDECWSDESHAVMI